MINQIFHGNALTGIKSIPDKSINCCVTSPPYFGLRDYGTAEQIGLEQTPNEFVAKLVQVFTEVHRVLKDDGTLWLNLGDSYAGSWGNAGGKNRGSGSQREITNGSTIKDQSERNGDFVPPAKYGFKEAGIKPKDLIGIPWMVAFALRSAGWYLRQDIIWHKPNPMPESVTDRCTKSHEYIFLFSKSQRYYYDAESIKTEAVRSNEPQTFGGKKGKNYTPTHTDPNYRNGSEQWGRVFTTGEKANKRSVWTVTTKPFKEAHFATFPPDLIEPCILAGCPEGGVVLDPFMGAGTTALVALRNNRCFTGFELNTDYIDIAERRLLKEFPEYKDELL